MIESVVEAFVDTKMERSDISMALYATAFGVPERALANKVGKRAQAALVSMLATAPNTKLADLRSQVLCLFQRWGAQHELFSKLGPRHGWCVCCERS
jgi:hypothetical protein